MIYDFTDIEVLDKIYYKGDPKLIEILQRWYNNFEKQLFQNITK